jgi:hypothetical protein
MECGGSKMAIGILLGNTTLFILSGNQNTTTNSIMEKPKNQEEQDSTMVQIL